MEKEKLESLLIEYIDGLLPESERKTVDVILAENAEARVLYAQLKEVIGALDNTPALEPAASLRSKFDHLLEKEIADRAAKPGKQVFLSPATYRIAASVIILIGVSLGFWIYQARQQQLEIARMRDEIEGAKRVMMAMLENQQSASSRVRGATVAYEMTNTDDDIVRVLVRTMNEDPNTNVRLAALEALGKFNTQAHVRKALIASLATQKDPLVQIALIQLMVQMKEKGAVNDLEKMVNDIQTMKAVKDEAYSGLMKLS